MRAIGKIILNVLIWVLGIHVSHSQDVKVELGPSEIAENQVFTITLTVENERLRNYGPFPDIEGLIKRGTSSSTSTSFVNGRMTSSQSITQNYQPARQGVFVIPNFTLKVNDKDYTVQGKQLKIGPPVQRRRARDPFSPNDLFDDFFEQRERPTEFIDVEADAFLALTTDKSEVYVGEGFTTTLAFYVSESNRADMRFYDLGAQITEIVKKIKPNNCWEENFNIDNVNGEPVTINNKGYTQYKIFQATYYPLNEEDINFQTVGLKLIKYKRAKNPTFFGRNRQEDFETFYSKPKTVTISELPAHPLKERVAVGNYRLQEQISSKELQTGQSFSYSFNVVGEGNISAVEAPMIPENDVFDFYDPNVRQNIRRSSNKVRGTKNFDYYGIPKEPGQYDLGDYIFWVYFNPNMDQYDTLRPGTIVNITGESHKNQYISSNDLGSFYDNIEFEDNELRPLGNNPLTRIFANILIFAILAVSAVFVFKK